jgi:CRISPR-associated protein Cpf1
MKNITDFTGLYSVSKTLRFELIPQGRTLEHIQQSDILKKDEHRAGSYIAVKKIIDEYHKAFITSALSDLRLNFLDNYYLYYQLPNKDESQKKKFEEIQGKLRKQIAERFSRNERFKNLFAKELIRIDLKEFVSTDDEKKLVEEFDNFTTYFTGFHENRRNMYSAEDKSTAISFRLIHQNLPKFIDNMRVFDKVRVSPVANHFSTMLSDNELGSILQVQNVEDMFTLEYFNDTLTQKGIDVYNHLIGGFTMEDGGKKVKGLNEYINLFNQTAKKEDRLGKLKPLYKQILSDRLTASFIPEQFERDQEVLESTEKLFREIDEYVLNKQASGEHSIKELLTSLKDYDLYRIYLKNDLSLTDISKKMFGNWSVFQMGVDRYFETHNPKGTKEKEEKYQERKDAFRKSFDSFSIGFLNDCVQLLGDPYGIGIEEYFKQLGELRSESNNIDNLFVQISHSYQNIADLLNNPYAQEKDLAQEKNDVEKIKTFLDSLKALQWFIKPLLGYGNESDKDENFYGEFTALWTTLDQITPFYNKVHNYMTRKPYSQEKIKLNFENSTLLDGWDVNKETDNTSIILRKDGSYYLGIMDKKHNRIFRQGFNPDGKECYEKMEYKLLPGANKMLPKVFFSESRIKKFNPTDTLMENYRNETHKKGVNFNLRHCHELIEFFKLSIQKHEDWKNFGFCFTDTKKYSDLSDFYREVEHQGYKITFRDIPIAFINKMVDEGKLYLFQIYNKDFSPNSKGTPNMHTLYWKMLFNSENLSDVVYKLNGQAEVFYRKSSIKEKNIYIHKRDQPLNNKNELNPKRQSIFIMISSKTGDILWTSFSSMCPLP